MRTPSVTYPAGRGGTAPYPGTAPHLIAGATFRFSPSLSTLTKSGSQITAASDVGSSGLSLTTIGTGPALVASAKNGFAAALFTEAGLETLRCNGAGTTCGSDVPLTMIAVVQYLNISATKYSIAMAAGSPTPTDQKTIWLGQSNGKWFAGCQNASPGAVGGTTDGLLHIESLEYDPASGKFTCRIDGQIVAGPTAGTIASSSTFTPGIGCWAQGSGFGTDSLLFDATWYVGTKLTVPMRQSAERYLSRFYGVVR